MSNHLSCRGHSAGQCNERTACDNERMIRRVLNLAMIILRTSGALSALLLLIAASRDCTEQWHSTIAAFKRFPPGG